LRRRSWNGFSVTHCTRRAPDKFCHHVDIDTSLVHSKLAMNSNRSRPRWWLRITLAGAGALLLGYLATSVKAQIPRIASITLILGFFAIQGTQTFKAENRRPDYDSVAALISDTASRDDDIVMFAPFTLAAPTNGLDVALDAKRSEAAWLGFPTRLGASSREDETAAVLPDGVGRYAPLPVESEGDLFRRVEPSRTGNRTYLVVQKEDLAAFEKLTDSTPVSQMIDYMKAAPSERIFLPGLVGGVEVYVFYPPRSWR